MELLIIFLLILLNGVFSVSEMAFVSSRREKLEDWQGKKRKSVLMIIKMMEEPEKLLSSIQVGITIIGIISGMYSGLTLANDLMLILQKFQFLGKYAYPLALFLIVFFVTYLSIVIGELVPKTLALKNPEKIIVLFFPFVRGFLLFTYPVVSFLSGSTRIILKLFKIQNTSFGETDDPIKEILGMARIAVLKNKLHKDQVNIIANTMKIQTVFIKDIMVKKEEVKYLTANMSLNDALVASHAHHHTRYPLIDSQNNQEILGYVNFKDIVNAIRISPTDPSLRKICRPMIFVREQDKAVDVLRHLIKSFQHIALVKDDNNQPSGLITMENLLEIIVGDIKDEYDMLPEFFYNITDKRFLAGGGIKLSLLNKKLGTNFQDSERTLSQWLLEKYLKDIKIESQIPLENKMMIEIRKMSRSKINEVIIEMV